MQSAVHHAVVQASAIFSKLFRSFRYSKRTDKSHCVPTLDTRPAANRSGPGNSGSNKRRIIIPIRLQKSQTCTPSPGHRFSKDNRSQQPKQQEQQKDG